MTLESLLNVLDENATINLYIYFVEPMTMSVKELKQLAIIENRTVDKVYASDYECFTIFANY